MRRWPTKPLGEFLAKRNGSVDPSKFPDETFDLYSIPAFDAGEPELRAGHEIGSSKQVVESGSVLLSRIVPHIRRAWVVGANRGRRLIASGEWIVFRNPQIHQRFLRYFFVGDPFHAQFMQTVSGVGGSLLRAKTAEVAKIEIPVPPMTEQERIVKLLDEADELRKLRAQADRRAAALIPSLFHEMFGNPLTNSRGWPTKELRQLGRVVTGSTPPSAKVGMFGGEIPFITPGDLESNTRETMRYVTEAGAEEARTVRAGSTLVCCIGATIGKTDRSWKRSAFNQQINAVEWGDEIDDDYGVVCLKQASQTVIQQGSQTALPILKKSLFEKICIPVPPLPLQKEFAQRVTEIRAMQTVQATSRTHLDTLFQSMLHRAFNDKL
jgi:type I restriction enzyme, S subunit